MFDKVIDLNTCYLQKEPSNKIRTAIKEFSKENKLSFFDIKNQTGLLRNLIIRTSTTNELMVLVQFFENDIEKINLLMEYIKKTFKKITSLLYTINEKANNTPTSHTN
jgi:23S rRNA (uracil1939-C5)-methyltransferase